MLDGVNLSSTAELCGVCGTFSFQIHRYSRNLSKSDERFQGITKCFEKINGLQMAKMFLFVGDGAGGGSRIESALSHS